MRTLILQNIISNNTVYRLNSYIKDAKLKDVEVWFCAETDDNRIWTLQEKPNFVFRVLPSAKVQLKGKDLFTYFINLSILKQLQKNNPDQIIICGWDQFAYQAAFFWAWINRKHITLWSGSTVFEKSWRRTVTLPLVKFFISISTDYVAYGERAKDYLIQLGAKPDLVNIFLNDVNPDYFSKMAGKSRPKRTQFKKQYNISSRYNFLYVGQLIERKGILDLIEVYEELKKKEKLSSWGLVIVGYGALQNNLLTRIKENKIEDIVFLGSIDQYNLPSIYSCCDCLILPSKEEVWGLVVNEAIHSGLEVIVSSKAGVVGDLSKLTQKYQVFNDLSDLKAIMESYDNN